MGWKIRSTAPLGGTSMRFQRLGLSVTAAMTLAIVPAAAHAQISAPGVCLYMRDDCGRRDDVARQARERAQDRAARTEERVRLQADARQDRDLDMHVRNQLRADALADAREARTRTLRESQLRARDVQERVQLRSIERAADRQDAADRRSEARLTTRRIRW
jgi:hypothetical protein